MTELCPNCGASRPDRYCGRCGQNDRDYRRGFWSVGFEFARETFELDSRLLRTLRALLFRPGHLSNEFSRNRRAAYVSPVRLYLFTSFVFFLVLSISAGGWLSSLQTSDGEAPTEVDGDAAPADSALVAASGVLAVLDSLANADGVPGADEGPPTEPPAPARVEAFKARLSPTHRLKVDDVLGRPDDSVAKQVLGAVVGSFDPNEPAGRLGWLARYGRGLLIDLFHDPQAFLRQAIGNLPVAMFFLLPVFAVILALCHLRGKRMFVEHLVFGMHIHTFVFMMLATALLVPGETLGDLIRLLLVAVSPLYVLFAMRGFYGERWGRTLVKGFVVWSLYSVALFPGLVVAFLVRT